jgi:hypothetical protein
MGRREEEAAWALEHPGSGRLFCRQPRARAEHLGNSLETSVHDGKRVQELCWAPSLSGGNVGDCGVGTWRVLYSVHPWRVRAELSSRGASGILFVSALTLRQPATRVLALHVCLV